MMKFIKFQISHVVLGTLFLFLIVPSSICDNDVTNSHVFALSKTTNNTQVKPPHVNETIKNETHVDKDVNKPVTVKILVNNTPNITDTKNITKILNQTISIQPSNYKPHNHLPELDSGAITRAFLVLFVLSILVISYLIYRSFKLRSSPAQMVRKYGVLAHKQDIEMRPLPLDDDDDDDTTVFDASKLPLHLNRTA